MADEGAILSQLNIVVEDIGKAADFYRRLGVRVELPNEDGEPFHVGCSLDNDFDLDLDTVAFARIWNRGWAQRTGLAGRLVVGFSVPSRERVDELHAEFDAAGYSTLQPPFDAFWGARYAIIEDPDGVAVGLMSPVDPKRRYWPPENWPLQPSSPSP